ncbi:MAG: aspartate-semialdehyde dehydrogenase [Phycisphaerales bacterium]|nr:aspartate-semialdehyde dehydrogenase [Phycisphaerales bacterium]
MSPRTSDNPIVAVVGATGAVGQEFIRLIEERGFPHADVRLLASAGSAGRPLRCAGREVVVEELTEKSLRGVDVALFGVSAALARDFAPAAADSGALVVDNSSAFRMEKDVPLIVPEINAHELTGMKGEGAWQPGIVANPNCSTIILLVPLNPLRRVFGVERIVVSTYQAVSGAGAPAMDELAQQARDVLEGRPAQPRVFKEPCAFNIFSHDSAVDPDTGRNVEEQKIIDETRKIWRDESVQVAPTCVRVPVMRAHTESICVTLGAWATESEVRAALDGAPGIRIVDDRAANRFPTPLAASGRDEILVGRIRPDPTQGEEVVGGETRYRGWHLLVCGDQIRKGAALNAVQIAEHVLGLI